MGQDCAKSFEWSASLICLPIWGQAADNRLYTSGSGKDETHFKDVKETERLRLRGKCRPQEFMTDSWREKYKVETKANHNSAEVEKQKTQHWGSFSANMLSSKGCSHTWVTSVLGTSRDAGGHQLESALGTSTRLCQHQHCGQLYGQPSRRDPGTCNGGR